MVKKINKAIIQLIHNNNKNYENHKRTKEDIQNC